MKRMVIFLFTVCALPCQSQWAKDPFLGLHDYPLLAFGKHDTSLFVAYTGTDPRDSLLYKRSSDGSWIALGRGIDRTQGNITSFASLGRYFFAGQTFSDGSNAGAYRSTDNGAHWSSPLIGSPIGIHETTLFGGWGDIGIAYSSNDGKTWDSVRAVSSQVNAFGSIGASIFAATHDECLRSLNNGSTWEAVVMPLSNILHFTVVGSFIYASNGTQLIVSTDSGATWTLVNTGFNAAYLATDSVHLFAGGPSGVYMLDSSRTTWINENSDSANLKGRGIIALGVFDTLLFADFANGPHVNYELYSRSIPEMLRQSKGAVASAPQSSDTLSIYPNPARGIVTIVSGGASIERVVVMNLLGEKVLEVENIRVPQISMDISTLPSGTYFFENQTSHGPQLRKIAIER